MSDKVTYHSPLREQQAAATRARVLDALADLIREDGFEQLSFRALARRANVTEITVYRHFKDRQALLREFWHWMDQRLGNRGMPQSEAALLEDIPVVFAGFDAHQELMRAALLTPEGRAMRMSVQAQRRAGFERALAPATAGLTARERGRVAAVVQLLYSGYAWLSMRDHWGLDGKEAGEASAWAVRVLLEHLHRRPRSHRKTSASRTKSITKNPSRSKAPNP